jgi:hypothetical protein
MKNDPGDFLTAFDRVRTVHEHFRLDDRHEFLLLTEGSVPRQRMRIRAQAGGSRQSVRDMNDRPPLREAGTHGVILTQTIPQTIKSLGDGLTRETGKRLGAGVDLDAGKDALGRKSRRQRRAAGAVLTDRFVIHDDTAKELGGARGREEHFPVGTPALLGRPDPEGVEALRQGWDGLVGRQDPFSLRHQRLRDAFQFAARHRLFLPV